MIHYIVPAKFRGHSIDAFLKTWGDSLRDRVQPLTYMDLFRRKALAPGIVIFTHFEGLSPEERQLVHSLYVRLKKQKGSLLPMNDPARTLNRYDLGVRLFEAGINDFRPRYLDEDLSSVRFPAFVRLANEHGFWDSALVHSHEELRRAIETLRNTSPGLQPRDAIVVEFCDVCEGGLYRKYSALRIGDEIIPRHILFGSHWLTKYPDLIDEDKTAEELEFVRNFEHGERIRAIFDLAGTDYGRIDYSFRNGQLRVWEINTNPVIVPPPDDLHPGRRVSQTESARRILAAFERLDGLVSEGADVRLWRWFERRRRRQAREAGKRFIRERDDKIKALAEGSPRPDSDS